MTPEEQAKLEADQKAKGEAEAQAKADAEAKDAEFEAEIADLSDEEKEAKRASREANQSFDYEAELKREREARERAEKTLADKRFKESERRRQEREERGEADDKDGDKPLTASQLEEILSREREVTQRELQSSRINEIAKGLASSEAERNLIIEIHKNRSFPSHLSVEEQLEEAYVIANRKKLIGERNEALRALRGRDGTNKDVATTHRDAPKAGEPKLSPADQQAIKGAGFTWNGTHRRFEKKLSGGRTLVRNQDGSVSFAK